MQDIVRVAAVAAETKPGRIDENLEVIDLWTAKAAAQGAQLVLFPELSLSGFIPNHPAGNHEDWLRRALAEARRASIGLKSPPVAALRSMAARHGVYVSAGTIEDAGNVLYNTQLLIGPEGLAGYWRKMHVPMFEMPFYNGGPGPRVFDTPLGRLGTNICFDALM